MEHPEILAEIGIRLLTRLTYLHSFATVTS